LRKSITTYCRTLYGMAGERIIPILICRDVDDVQPFYEALGFRVTYRQQRPNPHLVVERDDIGLHFAGVPAFDPEQSMGSVIITVPDADGLYAAWRDGLRAHYGSVPLRGIPRLLRPRRKQGTATGFSVVDPGGNWLRVYRAGEPEETGGTGLDRVLRNAARQGDSKGDDAAAAGMLDRGLDRYAAAPATERVPALIYRAELAVRLGDPGTVRRLRDEVGALSLTAAERAALSEDLAALADLPTA
jgi:catechol 2,3-dioxygenase-like lactoylglutathione lyase family enzyme